MHTSIFHLHKVPYFFYFFLLQVFGHLLGSKFFDSPKGLLTYKQASLPITFSGIGLIPTITITPRAYLESWAFIILVIDVRFMVDQHPFLFEALTQININTFPFQQHLKVACDLLPPPTHMCLFPFE